MFVADCGWLRLPISRLFGVAADDDDDDDEEELTKGFTLWILFIHFSLFSVLFFFSFDNDVGKILKSYSEPSGDAFGE